MPGEMYIAPGIYLPLSDVEFEAVRASGPGGQHVNKTSSAIQLRFNVHAASLPCHIKARILSRADRRISNAGVLVLQVQDNRSQARNRQIALHRLKKIILAAATPPKARIKTRPSQGAVRRRLDKKTRRGEIKRNRRKPIDFD